jgi:hypothetical protein
MKWSLILKISRSTQADNPSISWTDNGTCISINLLQLSKHLNSTESLFSFKSLFDFIKCLDSLGFQRCFLDKKPGHEKFFNPYFQKDNPAGMSEIKLRDWNQPNYLSGKNFRLMNSPMQFVKNLQMEASKIPVSKLDFARLRQHLSLEKEKMKIQQELSSEPPMIEEFYNDFIPNPNYLDSKEIAGYYGTASMDQLRAAFPRYFPAYGGEGFDIYFNSCKKLTMFYNFQMMNKRLIPLPRSQWSTKLLHSMIPSKSRK